MVLCLAGFAAPASAARYTFTAAGQHGKVLVFKVRGLKSATIRSAQLRAHRYHRRLSVRSVQRAARRGRLAVRVPRRVARRLAAYPSRRRVRPKLIVSAVRRSPPTPVSGGPGSHLTSPGAPILSDAAATARVSRTGFEPRPQNTPPNHRMPSDSELGAWRSQSNYREVDAGDSYISHVTGHFTGTTDEVLQWAAWKWGLDEELLRAQAVNESDWDQFNEGDGGISYGILQLKSTKQLGTSPLSRQSTAFNADYAAMMLRHCYDGHADWLENGYRAGDFWGCLGYFFSGDWYDDGATAYIERVRGHLAARDWTRPGF